MSKRPTRDKLLAEWFWTDRWMGSSAFLLPQEPRGVYREMLTQAWMRGARLPNDHEAIRRATGTTAKEWARCWPILEKYWRVDGDNLVNDTQLEVYADAKAASERASNRGRAGAQARAQAALEHHSGDARVLLEHLNKDTLKHKPPSPSPSRTTATTAAAATGPPNGNGRPEDHGLSKSFLSREERLRTIAQGEGYLDALMAANPDQDRGWLLRQHSTVKGSGVYLVALDRAKGDEHLTRTVHSLRDAVEKAKATNSGEHGGLLTAAEHERRRRS